MYVGKKLKEFRTSKELNQNEIADKLEVSQSYYSSVELSKKPITKKMLKKIEEIWGIKREFFKPDEEKKMGDYSGGLSGGLPEDPVISIDKKSVEDAQYRSKAYAFQKRIVAEVAISEPEINQIADLIFKATEVGEFTENLGRIAHKVAINQTIKPEQYFKNGRFDEAKFKEDYISSYRRLLFLKPALENFVDASEKLFEFISRHDEEDIIYWEIPSGWVDEKVRIIAP